MKLSHDRKNEFPFFKSNATPLLLASLPALLIGLAFGMGKIVRDCSLTCNVGYELAPIAILAMGIVSIPISSLTVRWANRLGYRRWQLLSLGFVAVSFVFFWGSTYFVLTMMAETTITESATSLWTFPLGFIYLCFFIWLGAVGAIVAPNIKTTVYKLFADEQRASALAITSAAIILGSLAGAFLGGAIMSYVMRKLAVRYELARDSLIISMGLITLLILPVILLIDRYSKSSGRNFHRVRPAKGEEMEFPGLGRSNLHSSINLIIGNLKLKRMASLILITGIAETIMIYLFYWLISEQVQITNGRAIFFTNFYIWLNAWTLLMLVVGANRLINRFGLIFALVSMPVALSLGSAYLIVQTAILAMYILRVVHSALEQSLYGQGVDRMILSIHEKEAPGVKAILQGLAIRIGRGLGALLVLVLALGLGLSFSHMTVVYIIVLIFWAVVAITLRPHLKKPSSLAAPQLTLKSTDS